MEVVDVYGVTLDVVAKLVGFAVYTGPDASASHPDGEAAGVMVATIVIGGEGTLAVVGSAKFAAPDDERFVQQAALFQVGDEGCRGLVGVFALAHDLGGQVVVCVPALMVELHEAHTTFRKFAGQQAVGRVGARHEAFGAVKFDDVFGFVAHVGHFGDGRLHPVSHLVLLNFGLDFGIAEGLETLLVELCEAVEHPAAIGLIYGFGVVEVEYRVFAAAELYTLMHGVEKTVRPQFGVYTLAVAFAFGEQYAEGGQVFIRAAEAVTQPSPHAGPIAHLRSGLEKSQGRIVVDGLGVQGSDEAQVICHLSSIGQQLAQPSPMLAVLLKGKFGARQWKFGLIGRHAREPLAHADGCGEVLPVHFAQARLVVEEVQLGGRTVLEEIDDALRFWRKVRKTKRLHIVFRPAGEQVRDEQGAERDTAEAHAEAGEKFSAVHVQAVFEQCFFHDLHSNFSGQLIHIDHFWPRSSTTKEYVKTCY